MERASKFLSGLLRHFGHRFDIEIDEEGWANLEKVEEVLKERYNVDVKEIASRDAKGRFEIACGKIRAKYGHTILINTKWSEKGEIPSVLYHGTRPQAVSPILKEGILPMKRLEVHLSESIEDAIEVGKRYCKKPAVLKIDAEGMLKKGYEIRKKGRVYTADFVPAEFIQVFDA